MFISGLEGGAFTNLGLTFVRSFNALGVRAELVALGTVEESRVSAIGLPVYGLRSTRSSLASIPLARYLRKRRPDILLPLSTYFNIAAITASRLARVPTTHVVITEHTLMTRELEQYAERPIIRLATKHLVKRTYPWSAGLVAVSSDVLNDRVLNALYDTASRPFRVLPNPVPWRPVELKPSPVHPWLDGPRAAPTILAIGALGPAKDFHVLVQAVAQLHREGIGARLIVLGEGPLRSSLERASAEAGVGASVSFPGFVSDPLPLLRACDVFVLSSRWEGSPLALVEAMSCGCPIVATRCVSGVTDLIQNEVDGLLVDVGDAGAMAKAIRALIEDHGRAKALGEAARASSDRLAPNRVAQQYLAFFEECIRSRSSDPTPILSND